MLDLQYYIILVFSIKHHISSWCQWRIYIWHNIHHSIHQSPVVYFQALFHTIHFYIFLALTSHLQQVTSTPQSPRQPFITSTLFSTWLYFTKPARTSLVWDLLALSFKCHQIAWFGHHLTPRFILCASNLYPQFAVLPHLNSSLHSHHINKTSDT